MRYDSCDYLDLGRERYIGRSRSRNIEQTRPLNSVILYVHIIHLIGLLVLFLSTTCVRLLISLCVWEYESDELLFAYTSRLGWRFMIFVWGHFT